MAKLYRQHSLVGINRKFTQLRWISCATSSPQFRCREFCRGLLIFLNEDLVNEALVLLFDIKTSSSLDIPTDIYDTYNLHLLCDDKCKN